MVRISEFVFSPAAEFFGIVRPLVDGVMKIRMTITNVWIKLEGNRVAVMQKMRGIKCSKVKDKCPIQ